MMTVHEVSKISGVSIRALHHYDHIGLLHPARTTDAGYRLYDDAALERLQQIGLLELRRDHMQDLIDLARGIRSTGVKKMDFDAFDTKKIDEYAAQAKASWGKTEAYREYEQKSAGRSREEQQRMSAELMDIFREFGEIRTNACDSPEAAALVKKLQAHITANYYKCTDQILLSLGAMYAGGGDFTKNIDGVGGEGTAEFVNKAINAALSGK